jgi:DNA polymerase-2
MTHSLTAWLLDVYPNETDLTVWLIGSDGRRRRFVQDFAPSLYAAGPPARLRQLWLWLQNQPIPARPSRTERLDVFHGMTSVLQVQVPQPARLDELFRRMEAAFPDLTWYDADISIPLRYMAAFDVFPLARVEVQTSEVSQTSEVLHPLPKILNITPLDTPWELACTCPAPGEPVQLTRADASDPAPVPLRILSLEPDCDPSHAEPKSIIISYPRGGTATPCPYIRYSLPLDRPTALLASLRADLRRFDPDVILTQWGDTWLLPMLMEMAQPPSSPGPFPHLGEGEQDSYPPSLPMGEKGGRGEVRGLLPLNRDLSQPPVQRKERTYFSYGQIVYRGAQVLLRGRWHLDQHNAMLWQDYGLTGVLEMARVTRQPVQEAARLSPGTGISSMQFVTALQGGILIPWHKQQFETPKTALELMRADMGGMVYQPTVGLHRDVGGIDFVSMYPGIMVRFNISPEVSQTQTSEVCAQPPRSRAEQAGTSEVSRTASQTSEVYKTSEVYGSPGIIPRTLAPLLNKRLQLKLALLALPKYDCRRPVYQALASAHKWLLVTCFGYLGYKNARFGRIEAHEAVTAHGREALLRAKEAAEDMGFEILHMYVDGLWVHKEGCKQPADFQALLAEVTGRTGLPISMDGVYRWVVFLPSRVNSRVPVPNCYFGVFQDGSIKVRGIEARRRDTAAFIAETQMGLLEILARAPDADALKDVLPQAQAFARKRDQALRLGRVPLEQLLVAQKLSRELGEYSSPSPAARAVRQMQAAGRTVRPGQRVRLLFTLGKPGVRAWDIEGSPDPRTVDLPRYRTLLERAIRTVLQPVEQSVHGGLESECLYLFPAARSRLPHFEERNQG